MDINHALNCLRGGYIIRHNSVIRDFIAKQISTVCKDVECEPHLQTLDGETFVSGDSISRDRTPIST